MATVTLEYQVAAGVLPLTTLTTRVAGVNLFRGELDMLGMVVQSDDTAISGSEVVRTIVLETTSAGDENFPTAEALTYATKRLYGKALANNVPARVVTVDPVAVL